MVNNKYETSANFTYDDIESQKLNGKEGRQS